MLEGAIDGRNVSDSETSEVGFTEGEGDGFSIGAAAGCSLGGLAVGCSAGSDVGCSVGSTVGVTAGVEEVGLSDGMYVFFVMEVSVGPGVFREALEAIVVLGKTGVLGIVPSVITKIGRARESMPLELGSIISISSPPSSLSSSSLVSRAFIMLSLNSCKNSVVDGGGSSPGSFPWGHRHTSKGSCVLCPDCDCFADF